MSGRYYTHTIIDRFRVHNCILRGLVVYGLIIAMFLPGFEGLSFNINKGSAKAGGGGEKEAVIHYFNGTEWTTAALAMEAEREKADTVANSPLFYHNGIMWIKTDMYEKDVSGSRIMKVNLPLEKLAGIPDMPEGGLAGELNKEPITTPSKETAAGNKSLVLDQPSSKLEKNLDKEIVPITNKLSPTPTAAAPVVEKEAPVTVPVIAKPGVTTMLIPASTPSPVVVRDNTPVKSPITPAPITAPTVKTGADKPKSITEMNKPLAPAPIVAPTVKTGVEKPKSITEMNKPLAPAPIVAPTVKTGEEKPKTITEMNKPLAPAPIVAPTVKTGAEKPKTITEMNKPILAPMPKSMPTVGDVPSRPIAPPIVAPIKIAEPVKDQHQPLSMPIMVKPPAAQERIGNIVTVEAAPLSSEFSFKYDMPKPVKHEVAPMVNADNKPLVLVTPSMVVEKPAITPHTNPLVTVEEFRAPVVKNEPIKFTNTSAKLLTPAPLLKPDAKPVSLPLNYNIAPPRLINKTTSVAYKPEYKSAPRPENFVFAISEKLNGNLPLPQDTSKPKSATSPLTDFIKSEVKPLPTPSTETVKQEPKKEEAPKEEPKKDEKKKKSDSEPAPAALTLDTIKKIIQEEVNNAVGGKLPVSAVVAPAPAVDTTTVALPPSYTINDSIEELRKLNQQLQTELEEKLMLRNKLEGQVDQQRQIKKEAKLGGELGKKDTIKLEDGSYAIREYKFALDNEIFGWHPHWMRESYRNYDYSLLTTLAYFSYELNPTTGGYRTIHDWATTDVIELAQEKGCKVVLTVTCLNEKDLSLFLANPSAQANFVATIKDLIVERNANGVNINFEKLNYRYKREFVDLVATLSKTFKALNPSYQISITVPAIDYAGAYDVQALEPFVDLFVMMGYEYTGSYSASTGPTAPLNGGAKYAQYGLGSSIDAYLKNKVPSKKLILAIPYYGVQWEVEGKEVPGKAVKFLNSLSYAQIKTMFGDREPLFYEASLTPYYNTPIPGRYNMFEQVWFDNARSLGMKFDLIRNKELGGVGIWALGMDGGNKEFWNVLEDKFLQIVPVPIDTVQLKLAQGGSGTSWFRSKFTRLINILRRPSTYNPATSNFDNWLRMFMFIGGFTFLITRATFVIRRLQMGAQYKASKPYLYVLITSVAILSISMLMWVRITRFFETIYQSSSFLFTIGLILGVLLAVIFVFWILPKWLKNKEMP